MTIREVSQEGRVQGTVTDATTGTPLAVTIAVQGQSDRTATAPSGLYELSSPAGDYSLRVSATGYLTQTAALEIRAQETTAQDFALQAGTVRVYLPLVI